MTEDRRQARGLVGLYNRAVNALSFSAELYKLQRELNTRIDQPDTIEPAPRAHHPGVSRRFKRRRISIAEAYLMVVRDLYSPHHKARLRALRALMSASYHAKTIDMPLNTARVQLALMKEAIKNRDNPRRQLELLHDFSVSSYGQHQVIRRLCDELNIIELPETGAPLGELDMGFDLHVHDTSSSGRKNPTQLVIDAFIKGISRLTIAYSTPTAIDMMGEAIEAGRIVGIRVNIGVEFSPYSSGRRFHLMALLPHMERADDVKRFFEDNHHDLNRFLKGLEANQKHRIEAVERLIDNFNHVHLGELNEGFPDSDLYRIPKLRMKALGDFIPLTSVNRMHLGEFLFSSYRPVLTRRVLYLRAQRAKAAYDLKRKLISEWDFRIVDGKNTQVCQEFREVTPDVLRKRYFDNPKLGDYESAFEELENVAEQLTATGCALRVLHPLEHGLEKAKKLLDKRGVHIREVEIYNMQDSVHRDPDEILEFCRFVNGLNQEAARGGGSPLVPVCGSDATGRSPQIPGMGFIVRDKVMGRNKIRYLKRHMTLPDLVSRMVAAQGRPVDAEGAAGGAEIVSLGKISEATENRIGDDAEAEPEVIPIRRVVRYMNPALLNSLLVAIGFIVAYASIGPTFACVWFGITGLRNVIADLVSRRGVRLSAWSIRSVNFGNLARSLFWTGFSVPILGFVKAQFDLLWPFAAAGIVYNFVKFFFISLANGLYLATHNTLRGFDRKVVRANLFRSVISWPFASLSAPLGNLAGIPSIVQAKFWSDFVAGFIEGTGTYIRILRLGKRDVEEIVPRILREGTNDRNAAILDLLYQFYHEPRTRSSLREAMGTGVFLPMARMGRLLRRRRQPADLSGDLYCGLKAVIERDQTYHELVDYILEQHTEEIAVGLVRLLTTAYLPLREWLVAQGKLAPPTRGDAGTVRETEARETQ